MNPYDILGVSSSATDDEVKKAYRTLSKKYHPDANINSPHQAEYTEKFKQVQSAYKTIMDERKRGFTNQTYGSGQTNQSYQQSSYQYAGNDQAALNEAAAFINAGRYQEANQILEQMKTRSSIWFYYSAIAMQGLGNNITAVEYAQAAVNMEPSNFQYLMLLQQLQRGQTQYRAGQQTYGSPFGSSLNCCYSLLVMNCISRICCGVGIC